jgi:hypothetical protein
MGAAQYVALKLGSDGMTMVVESGPSEQISDAAETDRLCRYLSQVL